METTFTPLQSLAGGALIGAAAVMLMLLLGRVMGATGVLAGVLTPALRDDGSRENWSWEDWSWRAAVLAGMVSAPAALWLLSGHVVAVTVPVSTPLLIIGGVLVGLGVTFGSGCTSGHGVCGLARLSPRSLVATAAFMIATAATVFVLRHIVGG